MPVVFVAAAVAVVGVDEEEGLLLLRRSEGGTTGVGAAVDVLAVLMAMDATFKLDSSWLLFANSAEAAPLLFFCSPAKSKSG
jgi:hypothetical protein